MNTNTVGPHGPLPPTLCAPCGGDACPECYNRARSIFGSGFTSLLMERYRLCDPLLGLWDDLPGENDDEG